MVLIWVSPGMAITIGSFFLTKVVGERITAYPCRGEINYRVGDAEASLEKVKAHYVSLNSKTETTDGLNLELSNWCLNLYSSNIEPLLHLNIEAKGNAKLVSERIAEVEMLIKENV